MPIVTPEILKSYDFARSYQWAVSFPSYGGDFFPAINVSDPWLSAEVDQMQFGPHSAKFPIKAKLGSSISITSLVTDDYRLYEWLQEWRKAIQLPDYRVALIGEPDVARELHIERFDVTGALQAFTQLLVIPEGDFTADFGSDKSGPLSVSMNFAIVGYANV